MVNKLDLHFAQQNVANSMDKILTNFKEGSKITVVVRQPDNDEADFMMTSDNLADVIKTIERRMKADANQT